jgi:hypothetical protein
MANVYEFSKKFRAINPTTHKIVPNNYMGSAEFELGKAPKWFEKMSAIETGKKWDLLHRDHPGRIKGTDQYIAQPYYANLDHIIEIINLCLKYRLELNVSGSSSWYPGMTTGIVLTPTLKTYELLKLKPPPFAECVKKPEYLGEIKVRRRLYTTDQVEGAL